jgi:hypothetical protein
MILTDNSVTLVINGKPLTMSSAHSSFNEVKARIATHNFAGIEDLFDVSKAIVAFSSCKVSVKGDVVMYNGKPIHIYVVDRILAFMREGLPYQPLINFLEKLMQNPSFRAVNELYSFLEHGKLPICEDGDFLAYRNVTKDYKDIHTGTFYNSIGAVCEMPRNQVDEDSKHTCSSGLHFCSHEYLPHYSGGRTVIVKISPADVCAIPADYNDTKGRCCRYEVVADCEVQNQPTCWVTGASVCSTETLKDRRGVVSAETRAKLRKAALTQRRDDNGKFC